MDCEVLQVDVFTTRLNQGNPAGVVMNGDDFTTKEMQSIAKKVGFNETAFVCRSERADIRLRFFTPGHEMPLCGHATIGSIIAFCEHKKSQILSVETTVGLLKVEYQSDTKKVIMQQAYPEFIPFSSDVKALCGVLGIYLEDIHADLPIEYGCTGSWTLLVPVNSMDVLNRMTPSTNQFPSLLEQMPKASIHPFIVEEKPDSFYARHFSSPYSGTIEDSVTGTASGVIGAYALNYIYTNEKEKELQVSQGKHVNREGQVSVFVKRGHDGKHDVSISGTACINRLIQLKV